MRTLTRAKTEDPAGNRAALTTHTYDRLYQVKERERGDLTGTAPDYTGISNLQQDEAWTYDATGNWQASSNTAPTSAQARINNTANEITLLSSAAGDITPAYDPAGNMTTLPKAPGTATAQYDLKWDAWNRLVEVKDGSTVVASYTYDGLTRRLTKTNATETRDYYYDDQWRPVEERVNGNKERQYTWGLRDRWDLLRRKRSTGGSSLNETHFCLRDYLDPVAIVGTDGLVKERYSYDTFGSVRFSAPDYSARSASDFGWDFLFHAEFRDPDTKLYNYGYRYYDAGLGRWLSRDPIGEEGGLNLYGFVSNRQINRFDRLGLLGDPDLSKYIENGKFRMSGKVTVLVLSVELILAPVKRRFLRLSGPCNCEISLCEAIALAIEQVENFYPTAQEAINALFPTLYHPNQMDNTVAEQIGAQLGKMFEDHLQVLGCSSKASHRGNREACDECLGFQDRFKHNGTDNLRHIFGVLANGQIAGFTQYLDDKKEAEKGHPEDLAEMAADRMGQVMFTDLATAFGGDSPSGMGTEQLNRDEKWWKENRGILSRMWRKNLCK